MKKTEIDRLAYTKTYMCTPRHIHKASVIIPAKEVVLCFNPSSINKYMKIVFNNNDKNVDDDGADVDQDHK